MRLPQYPKLPIPTLKSRRNAAIVFAILWLVFSVWRATSDPTPWPGIAIAVLALAFLGEALFKHLEIRRRQRTYPLPGSSPIFSETES